MAGWLTLLRAVPWVEVVAAAPVVVKKARGLWNKYKGSAAHSLRPVDEMSDDVGDDSSDIMALDRRCSELEAIVQQSAELLEVLAVQNEKLVAEVSRMRARLKWISIVLVLFILSSGLYALSLLVR